MSLAGPRRGELVSSGSGRPAWGCRLLGGVPAGRVWAPFFSSVEEEAVQHHEPRGCRTPRNTFQQHCGEAKGLHPGAGSLWGRLPGGHPFATRASKVTDSRSYILDPSDPRSFGNQAKLVPVRPRGLTPGALSQTLAMRLFAKGQLVTAADHIQVPRSQPKVSFCYPGC